MIEFSINESLSEDERQEPHPFAEVPGLEDCPLAGLKSALTRQDSAEAPTDRQTALWTQPRGGTEERAVKTYRIDSIYTGPERSGTSSRGGTEERAVKTYRIDSIYTGPERSGTSSRGGTEERAVKTYRIDSIYTGPEGSGTSAFSPLDLPQDLPLSVQQWQTDNALKKQQRLFGSTARALSKGLERMERPRKKVRPGARRQD